MKHLMSMNTSSYCNITLCQICQNTGFHSLYFFRIRTIFWHTLYSSTSRFHDINHLLAGLCYHGNNTYLASETYIGGDCTVNCTCFAGGIAFCRKLCPIIFIICGPGEVPETYLEKVNSTSCSCTMNRCVPSK